MDAYMEYSNERGTWNVFICGEWYFEGTFEQAEECLQILSEDE
jgi:hypothetical protein